MVLTLEEFERADLKTKLKDLLNEAELIAPLRLEATHELEKHEQVGRAAERFSVSLDRLRRKLELFREQLKT